MLRFLFQRRVLCGIVVVICITAAIFVLCTKQKEQTKDVIRVAVPHKEDADKNNLPRAIVVPHHMVARIPMEETLATVQRLWGSHHPRRIYVISPDHFAKGPGWISVATHATQELTGKCPIDQEAAQDLLRRMKMHYATSGAGGAFYFEHGLYDVVPRVCAIFGTTPVVPVMLHDKTPRDAITLLAQELAQRMQDEDPSMVILSADFSHELTDALATIHDLRAYDMLRATYADDASRIDIDTAPGIAVLLEAIRSLDMPLFFHETAHTNSSQLAGRDVIGETTSHIMGYWSAAQEGADTRPPGTHILFGGDVMLDRDVRTAILAHGDDGTWITKKISRIFLGNDATVVNIEGPITQAPSRSVGSAPGSPNNYLFTFSPDMVTRVMMHIPRLVASIGNNHITNMGADGVKETIDFLTQKNIPFFGAVGAMHMQTTTVAASTPNAPCVTLVNYNQFLGSPSIEDTAQTIREATTQCAVVVYAHWGAEYTNALLPQLQHAAHAFVDAGAHAVIGAHAHVVGPIEVYKDRAIFYSLGNLIFDQFFAPETQQGALVSMRIDAANIYFVVTPVYANRIALSLAREPLRTEIIARMLAHAAIPAEIMEDLRQHRMITLPR